MRLPAHRDQYGVCHILNGFLLCFIPECSVFTSQMALAVGTKWFHKILHLVLLIGFHGLDLLAKFIFA
jgi:hypothetical protein